MAARTLIKFRIVHTRVGNFDQGEEITQEELGADNLQLERLLDLEAIEPVLVNPTDLVEDLTEEAPNPSASKAKKDQAEGPAT